MIDIRANQIYKMVANPKDAIVPNNCLTELFLDKHVDFLSNYDSNQTTKYDYAMSESLRMSGIYWAVTALDIMNGKEKMDKAEVKIYKVYSGNCSDIKPQIEKLCLLDMRL